MAVPTLVRMMADPVIIGASFATYYPFVVVAALFIGWKAAAGVAVTDAFLGNFLFVEPRYFLLSRPAEAGGVLLFLISCGLIIAVVDTLRRAVRELEEGAEREADLNAELRQLNAELQHRVTNTLTVVQALANRTFRGLSPDDEAVHKFHGRLRVLAEAHSILNSGKWELCRIPDLAERALAPFNSQGTIRLTGPACSLPERSCVPMVLALHELATNALKYGALSTPGGTVDVQWHVRDAAGDEPGQELVLDWTERGGPPVEPPTRRGLGSRLIARQTGIYDAALDYRPEGVTCRIVVREATRDQADAGQTGVG